MAETAVTEDEPPASLDLHPCSICGRTFLPQPLHKHYTICQKNATRKRRVFNSLKQRVVGTDLELFHQRSMLRKPDAVAAVVTPAPQRRASVDPPPMMQVLEEKHMELIKTMRAAKEMSVTSSGLGISQKAAVLSKRSACNERCPSCDRAFGPKAFDRHVEWCKEHKARVQRSTANIQVAKERLDARIKYQVPPLSKSKRVAIKDKYSTNPRTPDIPTAASTPLMTRSTTSLETTPFSRGGHNLPSATSVSSSTAMHSRSSFRLKDVAPRAAAGGARGAGKIGDGDDKCATTPVLPRRTCGGTEPMKSTHAKVAPQNKLNKTDVNTSDLTVSSLNQEFFKGTLPNKTMITWKDTVGSSTSNEITKVIMSPRKRPIKKTPKTTNILSREIVDKEQKLTSVNPLALEGNHGMKIQKQIVAAKPLILDCPVDYYLNETVQEIPKITKEFVNKLMPDNSTGPKIPPKLIVDNLLNAKNFSRINSYLDEAAADLKRPNNISRKVDSLNTLIRELSPDIAKTEQVENEITLTSIHAAKKGTANVTGQPGLRPYGRQERMADVLLADTNPTPQLELGDTLRPFSSKPKLMRSPRLSLKLPEKCSARIATNFVLKNIKNAGNTSPRNSRKRDGSQSPTKNAENLSPLNNRKRVGSESPTNISLNIIKEPRQNIISPSLKEKYDNPMKTRTASPELAHSAINEEIECKVQNLSPTNSVLENLTDCLSGSEHIHYVSLAEDLDDNVYFVSPRNINVSVTDATISANIEKAMTTEATQYSESDLPNPKVQLTIPKSPRRTSAQSSHTPKLRSINNTPRKSPKRKSIFTIPRSRANSPKTQISGSGKAVGQYLKKPLRNNEVDYTTMSCELDSLESGSPDKDPELEELYYSTNRSDVESITGLVSNVYSDALSKARLRQGLRKCNSEIFILKDDSLMHDAEYTSNTELEKGSVDKCNIGPVFEAIYDLQMQDELLALAGEQFIKMTQDRQVIPISNVESNSSNSEIPAIQSMNDLIDQTLDTDSNATFYVIPEKRRKLETASVIKANLRNNIKHIRRKNTLRNRGGYNVKDVDLKLNLRVTLNDSDNIDPNVISLEGNKQYQQLTGEQLPSKIYEHASESYQNRGKKQATLTNFIVDICQPPIEDEIPKLDLTETMLPSRPDSVLSCLSSISESVTPRFMEVMNILNRSKRNYINALDKIYEQSDEKLVTISESHFKKLSHFSKKAIEGQGDCSNFTRFPKINGATKIDKSSLDKYVFTAKINTFDQDAWDLISKNKFELPAIKEEKKASRHALGAQFSSGIFSNSKPKKQPSKSPSPSPSPSPSVDYNPFITAERQLMDLLDTDDFQPFKSSKIVPNTSRPHTTSNTPKNNTKSSKKTAQSAKKERASPSDKKKAVKNAENKSISSEKSKKDSNRSSVIEPPLEFDDNLQMDDFEFIENYINNAFDLGSNNELITDDDKCNKNYLQNDYKYSDDSSIDPRLINENDNLDYPGSFTPATLTPPLSDTETISSYKCGKTMLEPLVLAQTEYMDDNDDVDLDALLRDIDTLGKRFPKSKFSPAKDDLCSVSMHSSFGKSGGNNSTSSTDRMKKLSSLKRSISLLDPVVPKPKPLKNKQEVNDFLVEQQQKLMMKRDDEYTQEIEPSSLDKKEELFPVDHEMYEEYKRYEQMYLEEKEEKRLNSLAYANEEDLSSKKSSDSAYGSLNRKAPKVRSRSTKLTPLEPLHNPHIQPHHQITAHQNHHHHHHLNRTDSASSSGSDLSAAATAPIPIPPPNISKATSASPPKQGSKSPVARTLSPKQRQQQLDQRLSKFCHECGSKYPLNSAKFCVECGIKRLIL